MLFQPKFQDNPGGMLMLFVAVTGFGSANSSQIGCTKILCQEFVVAMLHVSGSMYMHLLSKTHVILA
jgi:hypothetical protein